MIIVVTTSLPAVDRWNAARTTPHARAKIYGRLGQDSSEVRIHLMSDLKQRKLCFSDIENFSLGLKYNWKSDKIK